VLALACQPTHLSAAPSRQARPDRNEQRLN
jgi:hypothetical protein